MEENVSEVWPVTEVVVLHLHSNSSSDISTTISYTVTCPSNTMHVVVLSLLFVATFSLSVPAANTSLRQHTDLMRSSYRDFVGSSLDDLFVDTDTDSDTDVIGDITTAMYTSPTTILLSHDTQPSPVFNYANLAAQKLFKLALSDMLRMESKDSAQPVAQSERAELLKRVTTNNCITDYSGIRVDSTGALFKISKATVFNLSSSSKVVGQACVFKLSDVEYL